MSAVCSAGHLGLLWVWWCERARGCRLQGPGQQSHRREPTSLSAASPAGAGKPGRLSASFSLFTKSHDVHRSQWLWAGNEILCVKNLAQRCSQSEFPWTAEATT